MLRTPLAIRQGVFRFTLASAVVLGAFATTPAHAAVTVTFGLSAGTYAPTGAACALSVPAGADGLAVLDAAKAKGCIASYKAVGPGQFGYYIACINEVCGDETSGMYATYWGMYENGVATGYGVSDFRAAPGDDLTFAYTTWAGCLLPTGCLP